MHTANSRWVTAALLSLFALAGVYITAVWTAHGQARENAALRGADQVSRQDFATASGALENITIYSLGLAIVLVALVALLRRRLDLAIAAVGIIVAGQVITQGLKRFVLTRPELVQVSGDYTANSFPSGHTTIAMTVLFAALIVVPYRWRGVTGLVLLGWALSIGAYTVTAKWHRVSDTVGADAIALLCGCLAAWWLSRRNGLRRYTGRAYPARVALISIVTAFTVVSLAIGAFLWIVPAMRGISGLTPNPADDYTIYLGANSLAAGFSGLAALVFWGLWHRLEVAPAGTQRRAVQGASSSAD